MENVMEVVAEVRANKGKYLHRGTIFELFSLLKGIQLVNPHFEGIERLAEFQEEVRGKYRVTSSQSWAGIFSYYSKGDEQALALFFDEWEQFLNKPSELTYRQSKKR